jgi:hypothetical protein
MAAYYREHSSNQEGFGGRYDPMPPPCPWNDRDNAVRRDREIGGQLERAVDRAVF